MFYAPLPSKVESMNKKKFGVEEIQVTKEFLDSFSNVQTMRQYRWGLERFINWYGKSPDEILSLRKDDLTPKANENPIDFRQRSKRFEKEIERFHSELSKTEKINTSRAATMGIRQFFRFYEMPMLIRKGSKINQKTVNESSFPLEITHVRKMFEVADLRERVYLSLATELALRVNDFLEIKKLDLPNLEGEAPLPLSIMTKKNKILAKGFISQETIDLLKIYLPTLPKEKIYLFPSNGDSHITHDRISVWLEALSNKAGISRNGKSLTHHCFRKMFLSASVDSGIGLTAGKMLCGKTIPMTDETYLISVKLRKHFITLKKLLNIKEQPSIDAEELEKRVNTRVDQELQNMRNVLSDYAIENKGIKAENLELKDRLKRLEDKVMNEQWAFSIVDKGLERNTDYMLLRNRVLKIMKDSTVET